MNRESSWRLIVFGLFLVYARGLFIDLMDVDASQYASIAMEMLQGGHWLGVQYRYADYLDKPPLLFWSSALSFAVFGLHAWAYKLPSVLAAGAGVYATWRFCRLFYSRATARNAAFVLASSVGAVLMCNDVRTDALLFGLTACAVWQSAEYLAFAKPRNVLLAGLFVGLAMLAKGPIGLVMPAFAVGTHLVLRRNWRRMWHWHWLLAAGVVALVLAPMAWGLYQQFDLHPEKVVLGRTGVSGLLFFFWQQSFGRITGSNIWKNDTSVFTFLHVYLWVFLPWPLLFAGALWRRGADLIRDRFSVPDGDEGYSVGGFALTFVALSLSHYRLPHYIFITLPWAAVLTARWLTVLPPRPWWIVQYGVFAVLAAVAIWLMRGVFPPAEPLVWTVWLLLTGALAWHCIRAPFPPHPDLLVMRSGIAAIAILVVVNFHFYPNLLPYQATIAAARAAQTAGIPPGKFAFFNRSGPALDFYSGRMLTAMSTPDEVRAGAAAGPFWLYTDGPGRARLDSAGVSYSPVWTMPHFEVALLTEMFMNGKTRAQALVPVYILKIDASKTAGSP